jgi:hypothetical protein
MRRVARGWRTVVVGWGAMAATGMGCSNARDSAPLVAHEHIAHAPPPPPRMAVTPLAPAPSAHVAPPTYAAPIANASVDARVLVITADGSNAAFSAIENTLQYLGTPFDVLNATTGATLTAGVLSSGSHGNYGAIFLDVGDLSVNGTSAFTDAEFTTLATYEASFGVRRVSLYTSPTADYGLSLNGSVDPSVSPISATCSAAGRSVFVGTNCDNPVNINQGFAYPASPTDGMTIPLLVDPAGNVYAATRTYSDGREALALTFAQASFYVSYLELAYGLVDWATRGLFVGERHTYAVPQIDDLFLSSDIYTGGTYRLSSSDMQAFANWLAATQGQALTAAFRPAYAVNGQGSQSMPGDPLTAKAVALGSTFAWLNHTWDHTDLTSLDYADTLSEFTRNSTYIQGLGLLPYSITNAVTPDISGLANPDAMQAIHDAGITQIVSDTSVAGENNPSPNAGILNALQPSVLEIPRIPSELYYNVSQPAEWIPEYEALRSPNATVDYATMIGTQSDALSSYMLNGENDPWMFHQANTRNYDSAGHSLLSDLLDASFAKYGAVMTLPIVSPTMDDLAARVRNRMAFNASGVVATIVAGASMTVSVTNAATVPVTGLCTPGAERYAGQTISYLQLGAGQSMTLSLTNCNSGAAGAGGAAGSAGAAGRGGAAGNGAAGMIGATGAAGNGTAGAAGVAGNGGAGMTGATGAAGNGAAGAAGTSGAGGAAGNEGGAGAGGAGESGGGETGAGGGGEGEGDASISTGGHVGGKGGTGEGATGGGGGQQGDAGYPPPTPGSTGCTCALGDDAPGPGAFLFSLLGGGLALRGRARRGKPAPAPRAAGSC